MANRIATYAGVVATALSLLGGAFAFTVKTVEAKYEAMAEAKEARLEIKYMNKHDSTMADYIRLRIECSK